MKLSAKAVSSVSSRRGPTITKNSVHLPKTKYLYSTISFVLLCARRQGADALFVSKSMRQTTAVSTFVNNSDSPSIENVKQLLQDANIECSAITIEPLEGPGFCNSVYNIHIEREQMQEKTHNQNQPDIHQQMVAKLFSPLAKQRMDPTRSIGHVDQVVADRELGPLLLASNENGILMDFVQGTTLTDELLHGKDNNAKDLCETIATKLAQFHCMDDCMEDKDDAYNMLWYSMNTMLSVMVANHPNLALNTYQNKWTILTLTEEVHRLRNCIQLLNLPLVIGHGDLKPSNIIVQKNNEVSLIDFELSGCNYRGFDIAKLFRVIQPISCNQKNINAFLRTYSCEIAGLTGSAEPPCLEEEMEWMLPLEAKIMLPLTWLEAAIFFLCSSSMDPANTENWNNLARMRLCSYEGSISSFEANCCAYRKATQQQ